MGLDTPMAQKNILFGRINGHLQAWFEERIIGVCLLTLGLLVVGCGHASIESARNAQYAETSSLRYSVDSEIPQCRDRAGFYRLLSDSAKQTIDDRGKYSLRVDIGRRPKNGKHIRVELLNEGGLSVDTIETSVGGHMDCPRVERLAASMASSLVEQTKSPHPTASRTNVSSPVLRLSRDYARSSQDKPLRNLISPVLRPSETHSHSPTHSESAPELERLRPSVKDLGPEKEPPYVPPPFPSAQVTSSRVTTEQVTTAQSKHEIVVRVTGDKPEEPSLSKGRYWSTGVGLLRGHDPHLHAALRVGGGYSFGPVTLEGDVSFASAVREINANHWPGAWMYALVANAGFCGRSPPLGMCLFGSVMHDGYRDKLPAAPSLNAGTAGDIRNSMSATNLSDFRFGGAFGAGVRVWYDMPANGSWALRSSFEMTIPIYLDVESPMRLWQRFSPTASVFLTFVRVM